MTRGWPVTLRSGRIGLRPIRRRDSAAWREIRGRNAAWLAPWEATAPGRMAPEQVSFGAMVRYFSREAAAGRMLPFVVTYDDQLVGQLTVGGILWGSLAGGHIGYWIDQRYAGRGITPTAVALATDHCFTTVGLHRIEINIRPENAASLRVVEKLGFRPEGRRLRYLHIDGDWRDHLSFALTVGEVPEGVLARWLRGRDRSDGVTGTPS
jgi:ribosomal-protein-alanine N-acetyltransferase